MKRNHVSTVTWTYGNRFVVAQTSDAGLAAAMTRAVLELADRETETGEKEAT